MKKLVLLLVAFAGLALLEPRSRAQIMKVIRPVSEARQQRSAARALRQIAIDVQRTEARTGRYPQPAAFAEWLLQTDRSVRDPWGSAYYLELFADSFVVGSPGPDSRKRTADDVRVARRREASAAGLGSALSPPAPPSSGVKSRAIRAAEAARKGKAQ